MSSSSIGTSMFPNEAINISKLIRSIKEGVKRYLPESSKWVVVLLDSTPIVHISLASLKNLPFAFLANEFAVNDLSHMLSSRITYIEATLLCLVSTICNIFFAIFYSGLVIASLGLSHNLNTSCRIHWINAAYGIASVGIGSVGSLFPSYGVGLNWIFLTSIVRTFLYSYEKDVSRFEKDLIRHVQSLASEHMYVIYDFFRTRVREGEFKGKYMPSLEHIESEIFSAKRMEHLLKLLSDIFKKWPEMTISPELEKKQKLASPAAHHHYV